MNTTAPDAPADAPVMTSGKAMPAPKTDDSPEARMSRRFPQKVRVGRLVGLPLVDDGNHRFAKVVAVVRTPEGKVRLVASTGGWFGFFARQVAVPIEVVAIVGPMIASMDMSPDETRAAPRWTPGRDVRIPDDQIIRIALTRR